MRSSTSIKPTNNQSGAAFAAPLLTVFAVFRVMTRSRYA